MVNRDELLDLIDSLENAKDAAIALDHSLAMGGKAEPCDEKLFRALRTFIRKWRQIATDEVERLEIRKGGRR